MLAALTMTVGNLVALRQTNIVRMLAYSSIAQGGFILMPLAVVGNNPQAHEDALTAVVTYLIIYAAMNLGAFAVIIAVVAQDALGRDLQLRRPVRATPPAWPSPWRSSCSRWPASRRSAAGSPSSGCSRRCWPPAAAGPWSSPSIGAVNSVIALFYYANVAREMFMNPAPDGDTTPVRVPQSLVAALGHHGCRRRC